VSLPPPPPADPLVGTNIACADCRAVLGYLGFTEFTAGTRSGAWTLFDPAERELGVRAEFTCRHHGSRGTWKASTIARRAQAEQRRFTSMFPDMPPPPFAVVRIP
jgi:hypothetical protein